MKIRRSGTIFSHLPSISAACGYFVGALCFVLLGPLGIEPKFGGSVTGLCRTLLVRAVFFIIIYIGSFSRHTTAICSLLFLTVGVGAGYSSAYLLGVYPERLLVYFLHTALSVLELIMMTSAFAATSKSVGERGERIFFFLGPVQAAIMLFWSAMPLL